MEVTLAQVLEARENRAFRQFQMNRQYGRPLVSFSMNIPGPVKLSPPIRRGFRQACIALEGALPESAILHREKIETVTGCEAIYAVDLNARDLKAITTAIEDTHPLGRLFDMDVLDESLQKLDREIVGGGDRSCIVCGAPGRGCASRRTHSVRSLQQAVNRLLLPPYLGELAVRSLLEEVHTTPKPGLVDENNTGSHRDMDLALFHRSAEALESYFTRCAALGMESAGQAPGETFPLLRQAGLRAEADMFAATGGVNTHKGAIFTMGILCGAGGRLWNPEGTWQEGALLREVAAMTRDAMARDFSGLGTGTAGERLYTAGGIRGIRGEVMDGLPSVGQIALPAFRSYRDGGRSRQEAGALTLLHLIARVEDTCLLHRGGVRGAKEAAEKAAALLAGDPTMAQVKRLDDWFIQRNLSPGGCADLLAATYFLDDLTRYCCVVN